MLLDGLLVLAAAATAVRNLDGNLAALPPVLVAVAPLVLRRR